MPDYHIVINATIAQIFIYSILCILAIYLIVKIAPALSWRLINSHANKCSLSRIKKIELSMAGEDPIKESVSAISGIHTYKLFILYLRDGQVNRAERMLQTAMTETQSIYIFMKAIDYYLSTGNTEQVKEIYEILLQRKRKSTKIHSGYASFLVSIEQYHEALIHYHICLYKHRYNNAYKNQAGYCYLQLGEYDVALPYFKKILSFDESQSVPFYNAAACYLNLQDYPNALKMLSKVPDKMRDCKYYYYLSRYHIESGSFEDAESSLIFAVKMTSEADVELSYYILSLLFNEYRQKDMFAELAKFCLSLTEVWKSKENYVVDGEDDSSDDTGDGDDEDDTGNGTDDGDGDDDAGDDTDNGDHNKKWLDFVEYWRVLGIVYSTEPEGLSYAGRSLPTMLVDHPEEHEYLHLNAVWCKKSGRNLEAVKHIKKAISLEKNEPLYFLDLSDYLTDIYDYTGSIKALEDGIFYNPQELVLYLELAAKLTIVRDYDRAGRTLKRLVESDPDNKDILESMLFFCLSQSKRKDAEQYYNRLKDLTPDSDTLESIEQEISIIKKPIRESLANFLKTNYYYLNESGEKAINEFEAGSSITIPEIKSLFDRVIQPQDKYSFILTDQDYTNYRLMEAKNYVWSEYIKQDVLRIRIEEFAINTHVHFSDELYTLSDTIDKSLVLDLRSNTGGDLVSAIKIAEILTPKCKLTALIGRDGNIMTEYESGDYQIKFKRIYILINEETASASETLVLILKKHLDNVTILGSKSYGKDIGLCTFEIKELSCLLMISCNTFLIDETLASKDGILPDVEIEKEADWVECITKA